MYSTSLKPTSELTSSLSCRVLLDRLLWPVTDQVSPLSFLPSLKATCHIFLSLLRTDFWFVGSRFARPIVTARDPLNPSAGIADLSKNPPATFF